MNKEQIIALREYYESLIAANVINQPNLFPSVKKLSLIIINLFDINIDFYHLLSESTNFIESQLFNKDYFGRINGENFSCGAPHAVIAELKKILLSDKSPLELIMHVHSLFMWKLYDLLPNQVPDTHRIGSTNQSNSGTLSYSQKLFQKIHENPEKIKEIKKEAVQQIFYNELFYQDKKIERSRVAKDQKVEPTYMLGIVRHSFFANLVPKISYLHKRAADIFLPDRNSNFTRSLNQLNLPNVAGASGTGGGLALCASLLGNFSKDEMQEYSTASMGYLVSGGNHGVDEVFSVFSKVDVPYTPGEYAKNLPQIFRNSSGYQKLITQFAEQIYDHLEQMSDNLHNQGYTLDISEIREHEILFKTFTGKSLEKFSPTNSSCKFSWESFEHIGYPHYDPKSSSNALTDKAGFFHLSGTPIEHPLICAIPYQKEKFDAVSNTNALLGYLSVINPFLELSNWAFVKIGLINAPVKTAQIEYDHFIFEQSNSHNQGEILAQQSLIAKGTTLEKAMVKLCGTKNIEKNSAKSEKVKQLLIEIINNNAKKSIKTEFFKACEIPNQHLRFKALAKIAEHVKSEIKNNFANPFNFNI